MDQRYYLSLVVLGLLIVGAWALSPNAAVPENADQAQVETIPTSVSPNESLPGANAVAVPGGNMANEPAIPIISLADQPEVSAKVDATAFSNHLNSERLSAIPDRKPSDTESLPLLNAGFRKPNPPELLGETESPEVASRANEAQVQFGMPNSQKPLSKLPNNRMVLKPIAKMSNPFSSNAKSSTDGGGQTESMASDPLFAISGSLQKTGSTPATLTSGIAGGGHSSPSPTVQRPGPPASLTNSSRRANTIGRDQYIWHLVGPTESLESISVQYFGDGGQAAAIARMNQDLIKDPQLLPVGDAIRIPTR